MCARWAPGADPDLIAAGAALAVWVPNVLGIAPTLRLADATGGDAAGAARRVARVPWLGGD